MAPQSQTPFEVGEKSDQTLEPIVTKCLVNYDETQDCYQEYFVTLLDKLDGLQIQLKFDVNMFIMAQGPKSKLKRGKNISTGMGLLLFS
jgi:hypothetical protein